MNDIRKIVMVSSVRIGEDRTVSIQMTMTSICMYVVSTCVLDNSGEYIDSPCNETFEMIQDAAARFDREYLKYKSQEITL